MKLTTVIYLVTFLTLPLMAMEETGSSKKDNYLRVFFNTPIQGVEFYQGASSSTESVSFLPNSQVLTEISFGHKGYFAGISFKGRDQSPERGKTKYSQYRFGFNRHKFGVKSYYQNFKGFHLDQPKRDDQSYFYFPNFETRNYGLLLSYYFSKDYIRGADTTEFHRLMEKEQKELRKDSSWVMKIGYDFNKLKNVPQQDEDLLEKPASDYIELTSGRFHNISLLWGIDFYYIIKNYFIDVKFAVGSGYQTQDFISRDQRVQDEEISTNFEIHVNTGFYFKQIIIAIKVESQRIESNLQHNRSFSSRMDNAGLFISKVF